MTARRRLSSWVPMTRLYAHRAGAAAVVPAGRVITAMAKKQAKPAPAAKSAAKAVQKAQKAEVKAGKKKPVAKVSTLTSCY